MNPSSTSRQEAPFQHDQQTPESPDAASGCLLRVYWMFLGHLLVAAIAYQIVQGGVSLTWADLAYWLGVMSVTAARYVDVHYLKGRTAEGQPATTRDWQRFSISTLVVAVVVWVAAHALGYFFQGGDFFAAFR